MGVNALVVEHFTIGLLLELRQQVRYEQAVMFDESAEVAEKKDVATPLWSKCEDETHTPKKWELGVLRDSHNFRARQQREKHLTLKCFLYRWKGREV